MLLTFQFFCRYVALGTEDIERRPTKRRRRNSDSNLYVNAKEELENREVEQHRFLERDKHEFVRQYLENIHEARSITTETSDSGIKTYGAPSEHQTEDIPGKFVVQCLSQPIL